MQLMSVNQSCLSQSCLKQANHILLYTSIAPVCAKHS